MNEREQMEIQFTPEEAERFRAWQKEQRAKLAAMRAEQREPWEADPDAWKGGDE